jgi:hypothetical protein
MEKKELQAKLAVQMKKVINDCDKQNMILYVGFSSFCKFDMFLYLKVDHFERAKRSIEIPKRHEQYKQKLIDDEKFHHDQEMKRVCLHVTFIFSLSKSLIFEQIAKAKASRQLSLDTQNRLLRMADGQRAFIDTVQNRRKADYEVHIFASL